MNIDAEILAKLLAPILSIIFGVILKKYSEGRSKLVTFLVHVSAFNLEDARIVVHTHSVVVRNTGNKAAKNVRIGHGILPPNITVYPHVLHSVERNVDGSGEIVLPVLVPKEQITVSYLYYPPIIWNQVNSGVKSDDGFAKTIQAIPMPQPNKFILACVWILMFVGASFLFYWVVRLGLYLAQITNN